MKTTIIAAILIAMGSLFVSFTPDPPEEEARYVVFKTWKVQVPQDGSQAEFDKLNKEYFDKVPAKNSSLVNYHALRHFFTADQKDYVEVMEFNSWNDINTFYEKNGEVMKTAWGDEKGRDAFFAKYNKYFPNAGHSDEIYVEEPSLRKINNVKAAANEAPHVYHMEIRKGRFSPNDREKVMALEKEYFDNITMKNDKVLSSRVFTHHTGGDSRDWVELREYKSLSDMEAAMNKSEDLEKSYFGSDDKVRAFYVNVEQYFDGHHDAIYREVTSVKK